MGIGLQWLISLLVQINISSSTTKLLSLQPQNLEISNEYHSVLLCITTQDILYF